MEKRIGMIIGIALLLIAIFGFLLSILAQLPKQETVNARAKTLPEIPRNMFASDNELTQTIRALNVPQNLPVTVNQNSLGRSNAFENF